MERAVRFHQGDLNPRFFNWPSLYMYVVAGAYGLVFGWSPDGVAGAFARNPAQFYLVARVLTALFGTATLAVLYFTGRLAYGRTVAILAAGLLAVDFLHVRDSHWVTTDVPLTFLVTLATFCALRYWRGGRARDAWAAGLAAGLATSMKYPGGLAFLGLLVAHAARHPGRPAWHRLVGRDTVAGAGLAVVGFALGTPFALLTPVAFLRGVIDELREVHTVQFGNEADAPGLPLSPPLLAAGSHGLARVPSRGGGARVGGGRSCRSGGGPPRVRRAVPRRHHDVELPVRALRDPAPADPHPPGGRRGGPDRGLGRRPRESVRVAPAAEGSRRRSSPRSRCCSSSRPWPAWSRTIGSSGGRTRASSAPAGSSARCRRAPASPSSPTSVSLPVARRQLREAPGTLAGLQQPPPPALAPSPSGREDGYWVVRLETYDLDRLVGDGVEYVVLSGFVYQRHRQACDRHPAPCRFYAELDARAELVFSASPGVDDAALRVGDIYSPLTRLRERRHPGPPIRIYRLPARGRA